MIQDAHSSGINGPPALACLAEALLETDDVESAREWAHKAVDYCVETGALAYEPCLHEWRAVFAETFGSNWDAKEELRRPSPVHRTRRHRPRRATGATDELIPDARALCARY